MPKLQFLEGRTFPEVKALTPHILSQIFTKVDYSRALILFDKWRKIGSPQYSLMEATTVGLENTVDNTLSILTTTCINQNSAFPTSLIP